MSDAAIFTLVLGGLFVLRIVAATIVFLLILPRGDRCPLCDAVTLRVESRGVRFLHLPLAKRWCLACGWEGMMRPAEPNASPTASTDQTVPLPNAEQPSRRP